MTAPSRTAKLKSNIFAIQELDTADLTSQITLVSKVGSQGRYRGVVKANGTALGEFSLAVLPSPAEASVAIDLSSNLSGIPLFSVVEKTGYVVLYISDDSIGPRTVQIFNDTGLLVDNLKLGPPQQVVIRLFRPGTHLVTDKAGGGTCTVTVNYPLPPPPPWDTSAVVVAVIRPDPANPSTQMKPDKVTISPLQPLVFSLVDKTHLVSDLLAVTDRSGNSFTKTLTDKGQKRNFKL